MRRFFPLFLAPVVLLAFACGGKDDPAPPQAEREQAVQVGVVQSLTGPGGVYGRTVLNGIELAIRELNEAGNEPRIDFTSTDDRSSVDDTKAAFTAFAGRKVTAVIGPTLSNTALEAVKVTQSASVVTIAPTTTALGITSAGDYVFRVALTEDVVVPAAIEAVSRLTTVKRAVLFLESDDAFSRASADAMRKGINAIGGMIVSEVDISKQPDLVQATSTLAGEDFDTFLVTPLVDKAASILKTIRGAGFTQAVIGGNSFNTLELAQLAGGSVEGAYVGAAWNPSATSADSRRFVVAYTKAYAAPPDQYAAQGYSSVQLLAAAIRRANATEPAAIRAALAALKDVETPLGSISFSETRDAVHVPVVQQYRGGRLVVVQ